MRMEMLGVRGGCSRSRRKMEMERQVVTRPKKASQIGCFLIQISLVVIATGIRLIKVFCTETELHYSRQQTLVDTEAVLDTRHNLGIVNDEAAIIFFLHPGLTLDQSFDLLNEFCTEGFLACIFLLSLFFRGVLSL
mmetsp:Transcript_10991/g.16211  ORF Transcript_10991/g.16211 Transcript_10991/m.16211 type:complete len:136 (-) Transcript_10991:413-820(-)